MGGVDKWVPVWIDGWMKAGREAGIIYIRMNGWVDEWMDG